MLEPDLLKLFIEPLNALGVSYMVTGSIASTLYGEPRVTHDVDIVVLLKAEQMAQLSTIYPLPEFYVPPMEVMLSEAARKRGSFNIIHADSGLKADIYLAGEDELNAWGLDHVRRYVENDIEVELAPPEYVIVNKLEYFREGGSEKHLRDIRSMLSISGELIDRPALNEWITRRGVVAEWEKVADTGKPTQN